MALPNIMRRLFRSDGYGPLLKPEIIPFASSLASNAADVAASTEWVKDLAAAPVYVDASVASSGDGFTAATAVKTISEGIEIGSSLPSGGFRLIIASGSYTEDVSLLYTRCSIELLGNVSLTGNISILNKSYIYILPSDYTLSVQGYINVDYDSSLHYQTILSITNSAGPYTLRCSTNSIITGEKSLYVNSTNTTDVILLTHGGVLSIGGVGSSIAITGSSNAYGITLDSGAIFFVKNDVTSLTIANGAVTTIGIYLKRSSCAFVRCATTIYAGMCGIKIDGNCCYVHSAALTITLTTYNSDAGIISIFNSAFGIDYSKNYTFTVNSSGNTANAVVANDHSVAMLNSNLACSGYFHGHVFAVINLSYSFIPSDVTVTNNATGLRYYVAGLSGLGVNGAGTSRIPGNANGYVAPDSFYV